MPKNSSFFILGFLFFVWHGANAQFKIKSQMGFNSIVNGQLELNSGGFVVYGFFENIPTDSGFHDVNLLHVDSKGNMIKSIKLSENNEAVIRKMGYKQDGSIYAWIFNKECNSGVKGNELILLDSSLTIKSRFLVLESFDLIKQPLFDIVPINGKQWVTAADKSLLVLSAIGKTKTRLPIAVKVEQILPIGNSKYFLRSERQVIVKDSLDRDYSSSFGENTIGIVKIDDASGLFCLGLEKSIVYINEKAESRQTISASYLKVDRLIDLIYEGDSLHLFGLKDGDIVHRVLNDADELVSQNTIIRLDQGVVFKKVNKWENGFLLSLERSIDNQNMDYTLAWNYTKEIEPSHFDLGLESIEIDTFWTKRSSVSNPALVNIEMFGTYTLSNHGKDTISDFQLHSKGLFSEQCNNNLITKKIDSTKVVPFSTSTFKFKFKDFDVDQTVNYPMCLSVSLPNGKIDSFMSNNAKCEDLRIKIDSPRPTNKLGLFPNPVNQGDDLKIGYSNLFQQIEIFDIQGNLIWFDEDEFSLNTQNIKKGFYIVKALDFSGRLYLQKLIVK